MSQPFKEPRKSNLDILTLADEMPDEEKSAPCGHDFKTSSTGYGGAARGA